MPKHIAREYLMRDPSRKKGSDWFRIENKQADDGSSVAEVYIYDEIGFWGTTASEFVQQLAGIASDKIDLHLNTPGGEIFDGIAIFNALKGHHASVDVYVDALAASAGSFIAQAGDNVYMARNATMMIHDGLALVYGNAQDMHETGDLLDKLSNNIADIYSQRAGGTVDEWRAFMREEVWYNAEEAVSAGLADKVIDVTSTENKTKFSLLNVFNNASRSDAPSPEEIRQRVFTRVKEARMSTKPGAPRNEGQQPEGQPPEGQEPEGVQPEGQQPEEEQAPTASATGTVTPVAPPTVPVPTADNRAPGTTGPFVFTMNGQSTSDFSAVQAYIDSLEGSQKEAKENNRKDFVKSLVDSSKITAVQMTAMETFALTLSDEQYQSWVASWDAAPSLPLLGSHAAGGTGADTTPAAKAENDDLEVAKAIVKQHKMANMAPDKIKATASYQKIVAAEPEFDLSTLK